MQLNNDVLNNIVDKIQINKILDDAEIFASSKHTDLLDAMIHICEINNVDLDTIAIAIRNNPVIFAKLTHEAEELNFIKKSARLPL